MWAQSTAAKAGEADGQQGRGDHGRAPIPTPPSDDAQNGRGTCRQNGDAHRQRERAPAKGSGHVEGESGRIRPEGVEDRAGRQPQVADDADRRERRCARNQAPRRPGGGRQAVGQDGASSPPADEAAERDEQSDEADPARRHGQGVDRG
jgi:hypothetical protein